MSIEDDITFYEQEEAQELFFEQSLKELSEDQIISYLGFHGDAIERRIRYCQKQAKELHNEGFFGPSLTLSITAIELAIRFLLLYPLIQGAFLSEEWSEILIKRILQGRTSNDHKLLLSVLNQWKINIREVTLKSGTPFLDALANIKTKRNKSVHTGESVEEKYSELGIEITDRIFDLIVYPVSQKLGFTLDITGKWCVLEHKNWKRSFNPKDPFIDS